MTYALNLDEPPVQAAVLITLDAMGQCLLRAAQAIEQGESGRQAAREELAILTLLARYVCHRLREPAKTDEEAPPCP